MDRWKEYCEELYADPSTSNGSHLQSEENNILENEKEPPPLRSEIVVAVKKLNNGKAPGHDGIPAELYKCGGDSMIDVIHQMCLDIWDTGQHI